MKTYKILDNGNEKLLLHCPKGVHKRVVIDRGVKIEEVESQPLVLVHKANGLCSLYRADEEKQVLEKITDHVTRVQYYIDSNFGDFFLYRRESDYFLQKLADREIIPLGSFFERGMFLSDELGKVKARFYTKNGFTEKLYVSVVFKKQYFDDYTAAICQRNDGFFDIWQTPLWDNREIFDYGRDLFIDPETEEYVRTQEDDRNPELGEIYYYDPQGQGYRLVYQGVNEAQFANAVLEIIESDNEDDDFGRALLFIFEQGEKVLLAETDDLEELAYCSESISIREWVWGEDEDNYYYLQKEPEPVAEEDEDENESETLEQEKEQPADRLPSEKKKSWFRRLWS